MVTGPRKKPTGERGDEVGSSTVRRPKGQPPCDSSAQGPPAEKTCAPFGGRNFFYYTNKSREPRDTIRRNERALGRKPGARSPRGALARGASPLRKAPTEGRLPGERLPTGTPRGHKREAPAPGDGERARPEGRWRRPFFRARPGRSLFQDVELDASVSGAAVFGGVGRDGLVGAKPFGGEAVAVDLALVDDVLADALGARR